MSKQCSRQCNADIRQCNADSSAETMAKYRRVDNAVDNAMQTVDNAMQTAVLKQWLNADSSAYTMTEQ